MICGTIQENIMKVKALKRLRSIKFNLVFAFTVFTIMLLWIAVAAVCAGIFIGVCILFGL